MTNVRKRFTVVMTLLMLASICMGITAHAAGVRTALGTPYATKPEVNNTLLSAVTSTGDGTAVDLGMTVSQYTCVMTWGGTAPTNVVVGLKGSIDNTNFDTLIETKTCTASPCIWHIVNAPVRYIKGSYVSKTDGAADTAVTLTCTAGGN